METVNAKITKATLFIEDHGILTFYVFLEWLGGGQGLGGYALDQYDRDQKKRSIGHGPGLIAMRRIMETVGVTAWDKLDGQLCRVQHDGWGSSRAPIIGHILDDKWFDLKKFMEANQDK